MKKFVALTAGILFSASAVAETCVGPAPCNYEPPCFGPGGCQPAEPVGPTELCLPDGCSLVLYRWVDRFMVATSNLPNGTPVFGVSAGACDQDVCPDIKNQAFSNMEWNAKVMNRAQRVNP